MRNAPIEPLPAPTTRPPVWHAVFWPTLIATAVLAFLGMYVLAGKLDPEPIHWRGERLDRMNRPLDRIALARAVGRGPRVLYFGDSTVSQYAPGQSLVVHTRNALRARHGHENSELRGLANPGLGIDIYAFVADRIADTGPDLVIWQLAYFHFNEFWPRTWGSPELVGYVERGRLPEILSLRYEQLGLTLSDIVLQQAIIRLDLHELHRTLRKGQLRFAGLRQRLAEALNLKRGRSPEVRARDLRNVKHLARISDPERRDRLSALGERGHFGSVLHGIEPETVGLQLLRSGLAALRESGIEVLVYMNPTNFDNLRRVGIYDERGKAQTLREIRQVTDETGAHFLDLSDFLSDEDFADASGHFRVDEGSEVPLRVAGAIAAAADRILRGQPVEAPEAAGRQGERSARPETGAGEPGADR